MQFTTERALRNFVQNAQNNCATEREFQNWLNDNTDKHTVIDVIDELDGEPLTYSAADLAELI